MANYSICGIDCDICRFKEEQNCNGCKAIAEAVGSIMKDRRFT